MVVLGIGNALKADDGVGPLVAQMLQERHPDVVFDTGQTPENFLGPIRRARPETIVLVDAADFGGEPGEIRLASAAEVHGLMLGTHAAPLSMFMAAISEETGAEVRLIAIQAMSTTLGGEMSEQVAAAVRDLVTALEALLGAT